MSTLLWVPLTRRLRRVPVVRLLHGRLAERAWSWDWEDQWSREWWPQGITWAGERLLVSWYAKSGGSRVSVVDLEARRYAHVTLLTPGGEPLEIHAGGLAWAEGWMYVAATAKGFWTLHESDLADGRAARSASDERRRDPATWQATALHRPDSPDGGPPLRWSFLDAVTTPGESRWSSSEERQRRASVETTHLYAGEYGRGDKTTRLWRLPVADGQPAGPIELLTSGPKGMQGVTMTDERLAVSTSHGPWTRGSLHHLSAVKEVAQQDAPSAVEEATQQDAPSAVEEVALQPSRNPHPGGRAARSASDERSSRPPHRHTLPIGVEDLAKDAEGRLWTPAEHPGRRAIVACSGR